MTTSPADALRVDGPSRTSVQQVVVIRPAVGGIAYVAHAVADEFRGRGVEVTELVGGEGGSPARDAAREVWSHRRRIRAAELVHVELGVTAVPTFWLALWACVIGARPMIVVHDGSIIVRSPGCGLIRTGPGQRDAIAHRILAPLFDRPLRTALIRWTRGWVTLTERARRQVAEAGLEPVAVVALGADPPMSLSVPSACETVVFAGYIAPAKGLDLLVAAWELVGDATGLRLVVLGNPSRQHADYAEELRNRLEAVDAPSSWLGWVDDDHAFHSAIGEAAIVVLPYRVSNPASGILIRAAVEGRAIVGTDVPAVRDFLVDGVSGSVVPCDDAEALAEELLDLARNPARRDELGRNAGARAAASCTWALQVDQLLEAYQPD